MLNSPITRNILPKITFLLTWFLRCFKKSFTKYTTQNPYVSLLKRNPCPSIFLFLGNASLEIKRKLKLTISRFYPHIQLRFVFTSKFTMYLFSDLKIEFLIICFHLLFTNTIADSVRIAILVKQGSS